MVDGGDLDIRGARRGREEQQREAVGSTGDGDPDPAPVGNQPAEIGGETPDERRIRSSWRRPCLW